MKTLQHGILETPTAYSCMIRMLLVHTGGRGTVQHLTNPKMMQISRFLLDGTLLTYELLQYDPAHIAAAVVYICLRTLWGDCEWNHQWAASVSVAASSGSTRPELDMTEDTIRPIARAVLTAKAKLNKIEGLRKKHHSCGSFETIFPCDL